jgi:hypothetical protein
MTEYLSRETDHLGQIQAALRGLIGYHSLGFELIQNADDASAASMVFDVRDDALIVENDARFNDCRQQELSECPWVTDGQPSCDFHNFRRVAGGAKRERQGTTGAFGIGFIAVYQITDRPELASNGRHWRINELAEPARRIAICPGCASCAALQGTRFVLPWARDPESPLRRALRAPAVSDDVPVELLETLRASLGSSLLFLRHLDRIDVRSNGRLIRGFERIVDGSRILVSDGASTTLWQVAQGDFAGAAEALRDRHGDFRIEPKRQSDVAIAIPEGLDGRGLLYAYLPTEHETGLRFHTNADFYTSPDRKRILFEEDYQAQWNRAALNAAAVALGTSVPFLGAFLGGLGLWKLALTAWQVHRGANDQGVEATLQRFWIELRQALTTEPVMLTSQAGWCRPGESALLDLDEADVREALPVLEGLDVKHVHPDIRPVVKEMPWHTELGIQSITIEFLVDTLVQAGLDKPTAEGALPSALRGFGPKVTLWKLTGRLLARKRSETERKTSEAALSACAIALGRDGSLWPCAMVHIADQRTIDLFSPIIPDVAFLEPSIPAEARSILEPLCRPFDTSAALESLEAVEAAERRPELLEPVADEVLSWFEAHRHEWGEDDSLVGRLRQLPLYRSPGGLRALSSLFLPGGFVDPLGLADLVAADFVDQHGPVLRALGARELSLSSYARDLLPRALAGLDQPSPQQTRALVEVLARHIGELKDDEEALRALRALAIVECTDGSFRLPGDCYLDEAPIRSLLGDAAFVAVIPPGHRAVRDLLELLGVSATPRPADIVLAARGLAASPLEQPAVDRVQRIIEHLGQELQVQRELPAQYQALRNLSWLPAEGDRERWWRPAQLFATYRAFLFQSQARFVDLPRRVQDRASQALHLLGLVEEPPAELVVAHLLHLAAEERPANREIYTFLDNNADHPAVTQLAGATCLDIGDGQYFRPDQVYWDENPFGTYRRQLGPDLRRYGRLFEKLGVRATPSPQDAIAVLEEISAKLGRENEPLSEEGDRSVFWACWRLLERALEDGRAQKVELAKLSRQKVIPGPHDLLVVPMNVLFEDWPGLAGEFPPLVAQHILQRPSGATLAMQAAGVATLSERLDIHIVELDGVAESALATERITERRAQIGRIIEHELGSSAWEAASAILLELQVMSAETLAIQYELTFRGAHYHASAKPVPTHFDEPSRILYVIPDTGALPWAPVARELGRAMAPSPASVSSLASALHGVLIASTSETATSLLDELGFPRLQEPETRSPPTAVAEELGQEGSYEAGAPEPAEREGPRPTRSPAGHPGQGSDRSQIGTDEYGGSSRYEGQHPTGVSEEGRPAKTSGRLRTYVEPDGRGGDIEAGHEREDHRREVDHAGISHVERFEREAGRDPEVMPPGNPGYDVVSRGAVGEIVRYIEVKSLGGRWALQGAGLSRRQFETARELGSRFWMYVVEHALSDDAKVWAIQNPAVRANQFLFDEGWRALAEAGGEDPGDDLGLLSPPAQALVEELLAQGADPPIVGFEVGPTDRQQVWQLEAAWPLQRIAILVDMNPRRDSWLSEQGWDARQVEDWTLGELLQALTDSPT